MLRRMRFVLASLVLAAPAFAGEAPIVGGTPATANEFPSVVDVEVGGGRCSGTLITDTWVLTAAHCVTPAVIGLPDQAAVTASVQLHFHSVDVTTAPGTVVGAKQTIPDPTFQPFVFGAGDAGLIELATPVTDIEPTAINVDPANASVGMMVTMVGYGANDAGTSGVEYVVDQTAVACSSVGLPGMMLDDAKLLCFDMRGGKGKCEGDSGGPSFGMLDGHLVEVGITSFGDTGCMMFGTDTRVDAERAFITAHVPEVNDRRDGGGCSAGGRGGPAMLALALGFAVRRRRGRARPRRFYDTGRRRPVHVGQPLRV